ncbi:HtrB Lauroyl/myristoyl acyltransferase [Candidatus Nanopelagicaceae bacterium]
MKDRIVLFAYLLGWWLVRTLPEKIAYSLFYWIGEFVHRRNGKSIQRLRSNLHMVKPELDELQLETLVAKSMSSYMRYWCDTFRIQNWSTDRIRKTVTTTNDQLLLDPMNDGRGVVIALPHSGNWDHAGAYFCSLGVPLVTVAERLKPEALFQKFLKHRESMGFEVLSLDSRSFLTLVKRAKERRLIALVADRDLSHSGIDVTFFGANARMPAGPALLAVKTGIPLVVAHVSYTQTGIHIDFHPVDVPTEGEESARIQATVQQTADLFAFGISQHPEDWHMLQRIWVEGKNLNAEGK